MLSEDYKQYFKMMMDRFKIKSLDKLSPEEKKKFFTAVDKSYKAKNEDLKEMTPPMSVSNPKAHAKLVQKALDRAKERQLPGTKTKLGTALQNKNHEKHSLAKKIIDKIKGKKKDKPKTNISKSDSQKYADLYGGGAKVESIEEAMSNRVKKAIMVAVQMGGDMTGAIKKIEKIKKGLSKDKKVMQALRLANEGTIKKTIKKAMMKSKNNMTGKKNIVAPTGPQYRENVAPNHDGKAAPHGSGYKEVDEGKKQYGQKLTDDFFKSVKKFEQEVIVLGKMATKIRGDRTDEKIILKMYKKHMGPFIELIRSWNSTTQKNPHISEGKIQVQGIGMYDDKTLKKKILGMTKDLQKLAKNDEWSKSSENAIKALGRMWGAYQEWARNNESVNEAAMELNKIKDAILMFQKKIKKQGSVTNARDEDHLKNLIKVYKQMGGKGVKESMIEGIFGKFDTGAGFKGNGMTVYDRNQEKSGDFRDIVHIAPNGKITIYDKNVKKEPKLMQSLNKISQEFKKAFKESVNEGMDKRQAGETLKQLGGNKFIMMTGAKNFAVGPKGMGFKIGRNSKGVNYIRIDLDRGRDLYNMEFIQMRGGNLKIKSKVKGVYNDQLQKIFTKHTGMYTSLGTMGR